MRDLSPDKNKDRFVEEIEATAQDSYRALAERLAKENVGKNTDLAYPIHWGFKKNGQYKKSLVKPDPQEKAPS